MNERINALKAIMTANHGHGPKMFKENILASLSAKVGQRLAAQKTNVAKSLTDKK